VYAAGVQWPWRDKVTAASQRVDVPGGQLRASNLLPTDQLTTLAAMLNLSRGIGDVQVTETTALGISAFYRGVSLISGTLASLAFLSYREHPVTGVRERVASIFDDPDPDGQVPYEWKQTAFMHLLLHGKCGALKIRNQGGALVALPLVHPGMFKERVPTLAEVREGKRPRGGLFFDITLDTGKVLTTDADGFWYVPGLSLDGKTGVSLLTYARVSLATTLSADQAAGKMFSSGAMIAGMVTPADDEDLSDDVDKIRSEVNAAVGGWENAGQIAVIARRLKFDRWQMSAVDAQFLQSRQFQIEEISRWLGVPPHLLMQTDKQTSWGTGVEMQDRALGRTVLNTWATGFEQRASRLLAKPRSVEFDFGTLERPAPEKEIELDLAQVAAGVMTVDEYRRRRGWAPLPGTAENTAPDPGPGG
jgi:HK97 family phage portal protein